MGQDPTFDLEKEIWSEGYQLIAGTDEVGRGCLAGPVVAASVILSPKNVPFGIRDSKKLSSLKREQLDLEIKKYCQCWAVGVGEVEEIDQINILNASKAAMVRSLENLSLQPDFVLVDGNQALEISTPQKTVIQGDAKSLSIAAASIVAKVFRDKLMVEMDKRFPDYGFGKHKGYGSLVHRKAMTQKGLSPIHRKTFRWQAVDD